MKTMLITLGLCLLFILGPAIAGIAAETTSPGGTASGALPDTGQTTCYDTGGAVIPCPQPGEPYYGQDGSYTINPPSFTKLDAAGSDLPDDAVSWAMVRDNVTGLIWEVKTNKDDVANYADPHDADNTYTWYDSDPTTNGGDPGTPGEGTDTQDFIAALNASNFGGYSDWRLPTIQELDTIVDLGRSNPAIDTAYFSGTPEWSIYWSSTTYAGSTALAWGMFFYDGNHAGHYNKSGYGHVRAVRGGQ